MANNKRDWTIKQIIQVANCIGLKFTNNGTSHYVFKYDGINGNISIPNHKDIHPDYITKFLKFIDKVEDLKKQTING